MITYYDFAGLSVSSWQNLQSNLLITFLFYCKDTGYKTDTS